MARDQDGQFTGSGATAVAGEPTRSRDAGADTGFFGHPRGLRTLFFTEMWERFSYYGMRALLILFMTAAATGSNPGLGFDTAKAGAIYGLYTACVYLMALPGGWIADRIIGQRRAVLIGGVIIALGHFSIAVGTLPTFYLGLAFIVIGTGLLKPNISTMVGELYPGDAGARRDAGFSIFYMGINLGAFLAPLITGFLGQRIDWHLGFGAAGVGMVLGLIQYVLGGGNLGEAGLYPDKSGGPDALARDRRNLVFGLAAAAVLIGGLFVFANVSIQAVADAGTVVIVSTAIVYLGYAIFFGGLQAQEKKRVVVIGVLFLAAALFWSGFEQAGSSLNLFAERLTNLDILGWDMPASWLQSVNALMIIGLAPVFAWAWVALSRRKLEPSIPAKFSLGLVFLGLGFVVMIAGSALAANGTRVSPMWLVMTYLLHTIGELCLSPVGLSAFTKLAPHRMVGQMMGIWFMAAALGNLIAGRVAGFFEALPLPQLFGAVAVFTVGAGLLLSLFIRPIRRLTGGVH